MAGFIIIGAYGTGGGGGGGGGAVFMMSDGFSSHSEAKGKFCEKISSLVKVAGDSSIEDLKKNCLQVQFEPGVCRILLPVASSAAICAFSPPSRVVLYLCYSAAFVVFAVV